MQENLYAASSRPSVLETNKVLRNTYMLLAMTLVFSAVCAGITMAVGISQMASFGNVYWCNSYYLVCHPKSG